MKCLFLSVYIPTEDVEEPVFYFFHSCIWDVSYTDKSSLHFGVGTLVPNKARLKLSTSIGRYLSISWTKVHAPMEL
jgi:nitrogen fixation protein